MEAAAAPPTRDKLEELTQAAALQYKREKFPEASELYSQATELQAELNGEMAPENADLLYLYGKALYKVAIATSDVLGGKVAQEDKNKKKAEKKAKAESAAEGSSKVANGAKTEQKGETVDSKPYFQLTGDENWTDSEDDEDATEEAEGGAEGEEEQDDFGNAFQVFDMARVLYAKKIEGLDGTGKGKSKTDISPESKQARERLADCYNFLVDIAFENETYHSAIPDARSALEIQQEFLDSWHPYVTEAHFKLSLALEFASVSKLRSEQADMEVGDSAEAKQEVDIGLRKEAAQQMELAIASLEERIKREQAEVNDLTDNEQKTNKMKSVKDAEEMLEDMKARLVDLNADPNATIDPAQGIDATVFQGLLGGILGADPETQKAKLEEASKSANDISGLVRTKKKEKEPAGAQAAESSSSKRKLEVEDGEASGKRAKTEDI
ncbi:hypothetical protein BDV96DRAFT_509192 [Lophiotrema nucula]|uniref:Tetratricopeptide SHNi-TPR domain-containing protein n=1 Tax=Lophiotrema nucula TaxID=690887 RepID=A0A6A5YGV8_9PLEO|nr:hypothetical protein BDV96DRAFT_509192 [Lophiotrema nucula]